VKLSLGMEQVRDEPVMHGICGWLSGEMVYVKWDGGRSCREAGKED
jgi:hypothetical protein